MELRFSWFSLGSCWAVMTCGPEGAGGWRHGGDGGLRGRDKGGTWLGVGTGLVSPRRWAAPGWALGWGQCHPGAGMWVVLREMQGQHQCPQKRGGWHLAGHGVGVTQRGCRWHPRWQEGGMLTLMCSTRQWGPSTWGLRRKGGFST